jgi:hypothetical protein
MFGGWEFWNDNFVDVFVWGAWTASHIYGVHGTAQSEHIYCSKLVANSNNIFYSVGLDACSYCLGCIGLKNQSYCILNKQYTKEERHKKVGEIFTQMEMSNDLGRYFPWSINPFYFNETAASLIQEFDKETVKTRWYLRRDEKIEVDVPDRMDVVTIDELSQYESRVDDKRTINPSILKKVIKDEKWNIYRVIKMEYDFLIKHGLPLPRKHWLERLKWHFRIR